MDVKELNKSQLILLAILLSFVVSIATGITTVTLMDQAPKSITVPINRVVRQTVEKIVPTEGKTVTQTVVVKEEDLVVDAIEKNKSAVFTITKEGFDEEMNSVEVSAGRGFTVSTDNLIVVDASLVFSGGVFYAKNESGKFKAEFVSSDKSGFAVLKIGAPLDEKNKLAFTVPDFGDFNKMKAGQKMILLGGGISSYIFDGNKNFKFTTVKSNSGSLVLNLDGEAIGMALGSEENSFISINTIIEVLKLKNSSET